jgi:hypothetical protein
MKKIKITLLLLSAITFMAVSCDRTKKTTGDPSSAETEKKTPLNPNGDSELAVVMRTMMESGKTMKAEIEANKPIAKYPEEIKSITTAKETDGMIDDRNVFNGLANYYLATLDSVYLPAADTKKQFNHMVKTCVDCHENYCHGPIPAIKKLYISAQ